MWTRLLSLTLLAIFSCSATAQLPSQRTSPINYFGRFHGFGYSDGYHECKEGRSTNTWSFWRPLDAMSSFYGQPTAPPNSRTKYSPPAARVMVPALGSHEYSTQRIEPVPMLDQSPTYSGPMRTAPLYSPAQLQPAPDAMAPPNLTPLQISPAPNSPSVPSLYEQVPPAPFQPNSPSDLDPLELPAPKTEQVPDSRANQTSRLMFRK
ncbi:MAG: hypothetical protein ABL921_14110 [Pirellula sp.]